MHKMVVLIRLLVAKQDRWTKLQCTGGERRNLGQKNDLSPGKRASATLLYCQTVLLTISDVILSRSSAAILFHPATSVMRNKTQLFWVYSDLQFSEPCSSMILLSSATWIVLRGRTICLHHDFFCTGPEASLVAQIFLCYPSTLFDGCGCSTTSRAL